VQPEMYPDTDINSCRTPTSTPGPPPTLIHKPQNT